MFKNCQSFLYRFDLIGINPQLLIFNNSRYKTIFSSIISIIIIIVSIIFGILSFSEYLKFENPIIVYSKDNDSKTKRVISIKDTLLMFQLIDTTNPFTIINKDIAYYSAEHSILFDNETYINTLLTVENCEIGKNIDLKYKKYFDEKNLFRRKIEDFYCINLNNLNKSLFYYPNIGYSYITLYIIFKNNSNYIPEKIQSLIVSESDLIDHNNKSNPISHNFDYHFTAAFSSVEYTKINYHFQFIKYESDNGLIYKKSKTLNGISFSDMTSFRNIQDDYDLKRDYKESSDLNIGRITLEINKSHYDNYKRTYPRLQTLLAEIMSVISLLFEIGRIITSILCNKKMSKNIIKSILNKNEKDFINIKNSNKIYNTFNNLQKKVNSSERNIRKNESDEKTSMSVRIDKNDINEENRTKVRNLQNKIINDIFKKINYYNIFKSLFCFKDNKTKFIDLCHNIIIEDMSIEIILERFYNLERIYSLVLNEESIDNDNCFFFKHNRYNEILKYIFKLNNEIKTNK